MTVSENRKRKLQNNRDNDTLKRMMNSEIDRLNDIQRDVQNVESCKERQKERQKKYTRKTEQYTDYTEQQTNYRMIKRNSDTENNRMIY